MVLGIGSSSAQGLAILMGDRPLATMMLAPSIFAVTIPADAVPGPAILRISANSQEAWPIAIQVEGPPLKLAEFLNAAGEKIDDSRPARIGDTVTIRLTQSVAMANPFHLPRVSVNVGGVDHLAQLDGDRIRFTLLPSAPERTVPVNITPLTIR